MGDPARVATSVVLAPPLSLLAALRHVMTARSTRRSRLRDELRAALGVRHRFAVDPLADTATVIPDAYAPIAPRADTTISQHVEFLHDMPDSVLVDELTARFGPDLPPTWAQVVTQPRRWRHSWATTSAEAWAVLGPRWKSADRQLDREVRRIGMAVARGGVDVLLNSLHPRLSYRAGEAKFDCDVSDIYALSGRRLVLVPLIGADDVMVSFDRPDLAYIAYPLRPIGHLDGAVHDDLQTILGDIKSSTLRALARPHTVGELAAEIGVAAATMSYHCDSLETAGLVNRSRAGRRVMVSRTFRGAELMELFSG